jgi:hypothetical protein
MISPASHFSHHGVLDDDKFFALVLGKSVGSRDELRQQSDNPGQLEEIFLSLTTDQK